MALDVIRPHDAPGVPYLGLEEGGGAEDVDGTVLVDAVEGGGGAQ